MVEIFKTGALVFFFLFFCGVVIWTFWSRRSKSFSHDAFLPLDEGARVSPDGNEIR